jgi:hypothetical protein
VSRWWRSPLILIPVGVAGSVALIMIAALAMSIADLGAANAACTVAGPGPSGVAGIPGQFLPYFEGAGSYFQLGGEGWAYLAALNYAESRFDSPGAGVFSGSNSAGAAGPMQIGIGGAATDNWDTYKLDIPADLSGGTQPPSVYNEADAVYAAGAKLRGDGAPADWLAALTAWNDYPPEIQQVTSLVAQYTQAPGTGASAIRGGPTISSAVAGSCVPLSGPSVPGAVARILPDGTAAIPADAPGQVQEAIAAGNRIIDTSYSNERDPNMLSTIMSSYDCSGSTDYVLYNAGLNTPQVDVGGAVAGDSTDLESYANPGAGQWITVFASAGHAFIEVAGLVLDTSHYAPTAPAGTGPRWQPASILPAQLADGNVWTQRHPGGL